MKKKRVGYFAGGFGRCLLAAMLFGATGLFAQGDLAGVNPQELKKLSLEDLMQLDVTSVAKEPQPYGEAPAALEVLTSDEIRRSGATTIAESLRLADNLDVAQLTPYNWSISARGFNASVNNKLLVLMDGRSVYDPLFSGVIWANQDYLLEDLERIEVISGPGGTLWGANAVNGVINITTKSAKATQGLYLEAAAGTQMEQLGGLRYGGTLASNVYFRVYAKYANYADDVFASGKDAADNFSQARTGFRIDSEASSQNLLTVQGDYYDGGEDIVTGGKGRQSGGNLLARWSHTISEDQDVSVQAYYSRDLLLDPYPAAPAFGAAAGPLKDALDTYDLQFQHRFAAGRRNRFVWGFEYRFTHDMVDSAPLVAFLPQHFDQNLVSAFMQDEIMLCDKVYATIGTKVEHNDYTGFEFEPSGRLQWNLTPKQMLWAAVSRAVRTPSRYDEDLYEPAPPRPTFLEGNPNFVSETLIAYELGYRAQLGRKISTSISAFYNDYDHVRSLAFTPVTFVPLYFANDLQAQTEGFEFSADYQMLTWWRLHAGYDLLKEYIHVRPGGSDLYQTHNETADPQQQFQIRSSMDLPYHLELDGALRWVDTLHVNNGPTVGTVPSYFEMDARLAWHATKNLELSIVGQNMLHDHHPEYGFPSPAREEIERDVYAKATLRF